MAVVGALCAGPESEGGGGFDSELCCPVEDCVDAEGMASGRSLEGDGGEHGEVAEPRDGRVSRRCAVLAGSPVEVSRGFVPCMLEGSPIFHLSPTYRGY